MNTAEELEDQMKEGMQKVTGKEEGKLQKGLRAQDRSGNMWMVSIPESDRNRRIEKADSKRKSSPSQS